MSANIRWLMLACLLSGCGVDTSGTPTTGSASSYQGAGSQWTAKLANDATFMLLHFAQLDDTTADQLINGNDTIDANGFTGLTVTSAAGMGEPAAGATSSALQIAGALFVLAPFTAGPLLPMIPQYGCPGGVVNANLVKVKVASGWSATTGDATATLAYDATSGVAILPARYGAADPAMALAGGELALGAGACRDGVVAASGGAELFLSATGVVVHMQPANEAQGLDEVYFGLPQADAAIVPASLVGNYAGFLFADEATPETVPIVLTLAASGTSVTGAATTTTGTVGALVTLTGAGAANGLLVGTLNTPSASVGGSDQPLSCAVQLAVGAAAQNVLVCASAGPDARFVGLILVSH